MAVCEAVVLHWQWHLNIVISNTGIADDDFCVYCPSPIYWWQLLHVLQEC